MSETMTRQQAPARRAGVWHRWPVWTPWAATVWAAGYAAVALGWTFTGMGYPMNRGGDADLMALLGDVPADVGAPLFAAVALAAAAVGVATVRTGPAVSPGRRRLTLAFGTILSATLLLAVPDTRALALVGYVPMLVVTAPFDPELRDQLGEALSPGYLHQAAALVGGFLWAAATLAYARRTAGTCRWCGRGDRLRTWTTPQAAARWGRPAVYVAAVIPALYAVTRWIWVAGVPLGIDEDLHAEGMTDGSLWSGAWLASFALVGTVLTLGLVQRWGEVIPRWVPVLRGRPVPVGLAVGPAAVVAALVTSGGLGLIKASRADGAFTLDADGWAAVGPAMLWPLWGVALAAGTLAYYLRRRGQCAECGRS
ncbi:hypothetical protein [Jiangella asiatica]|uniref:Uncharacterized protein n=1 Tax=Jiangella asiatica TaxID=2530372 RepID=A0A4R5CF65_9ACTN|nr:hypothetical protein [Jiangella asiatica]TDD98225.1 hypothetical protein E1269_28985 [Jiangella asiatica]